MKFNFNINRIRFRVGSGQRGESWVVGICITRGNGALNGALQPVPAKRSILGSALLHMFLSDGQGVLQFGLFDSESFTTLWASTCAFKSYFTFLHNAQEFARLLQFWKAVFFRQKFARMHASSAPP